MAFAPCRAASIVAESLDERLTQTTPSAPSAAIASNAAWNCPGEGAEVSGRPSNRRQRDQNSLVDKLDPIHQLFVSEPDPERNKTDAELGQQIVWQVTGAVGHHTDARHILPLWPDLGPAPDWSTARWTTGAGRW